MGNLTVFNGTQFVKPKNFHICNGLEWLKAKAIHHFDGIQWVKDWSSFALPVFTGQHAIFGDETQGRIELYSSGDLTLDNREYDVFLVGGGGAGASGGGGGGYTQSYAKRILNGKFTTVIGSGGTRTSTNANKGGNSQFTGIDIVFNVSAFGGGSNRNVGISNGDSGGSGGGGFGSIEEGTGYSGGNGGSDGSNGWGGTSSGGNGQRSTTRAFGETGNILFAGGGGGGSVQSAPSVGFGGLGGGGNGSKMNAIIATLPAANSGGGGGGGYNTGLYVGTVGASGIIIIRWGY